MGGLCRIFATFTVVEKKKQLCRKKQQHFFLKKNPPWRERGGNPNPPPPVTPCILLNRRCTPAASEKKIIHLHEVEGTEDIEYLREEGEKTPRANLKVPSDSGRHCICAGVVGGGLQGGAACILVWEDAHPKKWLPLWVGVEARTCAASWG